MEPSLLREPSQDLEDPSEEKEEEVFSHHEDSDLD